ncbi:uroporphyrin-III C-methyltransferase [Ephemerocybe angulata]|uniref:precorrin-2 dehydrogenase n=1 Tax=Ephemerocybe angulata TaxID=980116 RepID=A0A8H6I9G1_9AGAR|nr:uroporphyrin-III C-methyltransferase [Tulosesus angulatus]
MLEYPTPSQGASLILAFRPQKVLIIGSGPLAASRAFSALEAESEVHILAQGGLEDACDELKWRASQGQVTESASTSTAQPDEIAGLEKFLDDTPGVSLACITDTAVRPHRRSRESCERVYRTLKARNIQVNSTDVPELCDFTFTSTHRVAESALQIGVTTNGQGCRLSSRLRRDIVSKLPPTTAAAVRNVGQLRSLAKEKGRHSCDGEDDGGHDETEGASVSTPNSLASETKPESIDIPEYYSAVSTPNRPVPTRSSTETETESTRRRMKWVAQVSEYWPLSKLASLTPDDMTALLEGRVPETPLTQSLMSLALPPTPTHNLPNSKRGRIFLVGSGPGHPSLLTQATHTVLTRLADLVLSDKLVPDAVLALIPKSVEIRIAKKFPGNAEGAQMEMMEAAIEAANRGLTVVRLKQGDPVVYGRAGEEVLYFRAHGLEPLVIPGVSSALAAPTFANIPVTQRGAAESFTVCTGVGRRGKEITLPAYERARTLVILMGVARLPQVVDALVAADAGARRLGAAYPGNTPVAIIERASMPDQRVVTSTLRDIVQALESSGEQRPPGMIVVGWSVLCLYGKGDTGVLEEGAEKGDEGRVERWLAGGRWRVEEGVDPSWELLNV